ncbi:mannose-6-phosphate isomerase, class I [Amnibacterium endophyticum]|uniref:mannose-6-phosphate isomerase n=1 Tax=Amnibacterium endophyticum TaxID=2109337 RepID=A0ABW4LEJ2_9MICO
MFVGIEGAMKDYAWGSRKAIADLTGREPSGGPEAELWFGAHPAGPSTATGATPGSAGRRLDDLIAEDPAAALGPRYERLPFLLKLLAADEPLSLQVHPDAEQAKTGFAREERSGVPIEAAERNYRDDSPKPELILALSPTFEALAGFRHLSETRMLLAELGAVAEGDDRGVIRGLAERLEAGDPAATGSTGSSWHVVEDGMPGEGTTVPAHSGSGNALQDFVEHALRGGEDVDREVAAVVRAAARMSATSSFAREWETIGVLADTSPGDPGILVALLLNRVSLQQGQALALGAGVPHAYLEGFGVELMAASDNVLRGGLTSKHVDVDELLAIMRFEALPVPAIRPEEPTDGAVVYRPAEGDFELARIAIGDEAAVHGYRLSGPAAVTMPLNGPAIVLVLSGTARVAGTEGAVDLARGEAAFVSPDEGPLTFTGSAIAVVATTP